MPKKAPLEKVTLKLYFGTTRKMCALLNLYIQVYLCTRMSCENSNAILLSTELVMACCHDTAVFVSVHIIKTTLKTIVLGCAS